MLHVILLIFVFIFSTSTVLAGGKCRVFDELADTKHFSNQSFRRMVEETCGRRACSVDDAEELLRRQARHQKPEVDTHQGSDAHRRANEQFQSVVRGLKLTKDQQRRLHDEVTHQNLSRQEILERARDMFSGD